MEVDMYPLADPGRADYIDGAIGDGSWCEYTNGYFAHGVGPTTAKALAGWIDRLVRVDVDPAVPGRNPVAYCMERHGMVLAKLVRGEAPRLRNPGSRPSTPKDAPAPNLETEASN